MCVCTCTHTHTELCNVHLYPFYGSTLVTVSFCIPHSGYENEIFLFKDFRRPNIRIKLHGYNTRYELIHI